MQNVSSSFTLAAIIVAICALADILISKKEQDHIRLILLRGWFALDETTVSKKLHRSANAILDVFDVVYGRRQWSWKCFKRSFFVSVIVILLLNLTFWSSIGHYSQAVSVRLASHLKHEKFDEIFASIGLSLMVNVVVDFLALWKSRGILSHARVVKPIYHIGLLIADLLSSYAFYVALMLIAGIVGTIMTEGSISLLYDVAGHPVSEAYAVLIMPYLSLKSLFGSGSTLTPTIGVSLLSTLSTSLVFAIYNALALISTSVHVSRGRLMSAVESLFESKAMFTAIGGAVSASIVVLKAVAHILFSFA